MANVQYYDVILKPVITEKSMEDMSAKKYTFLVTRKLTRLRLKKQLRKCSREPRLPRSTQ